MNNIVSPLDLSQYFFYPVEIQALAAECKRQRDQIATFQADKAKLREVLGGIVNSINLVLVAGD